MVDCGADWRGEIGELKLDAIVVTHAHPDHAWDLEDGAPCPVYAPESAWRLKEDYDVREWRLIEPRKELYVGDGATVTRSMVRRRDDALIGHSPIRTQLTWRQKEGVPRAIFTHCGSEIGGDKRQLASKVHEMAEERGVGACIAADGMEVVMR